MCAPTVAWKVQYCTLLHPCVEVPCRQVLLRAPTTEYERCLLWNTGIRMAFETDAVQLANTANPGVNGVQSYKMDDE